MTKKSKKIIWAPLTIAILVLLMVFSRNTTLGSGARNIIASLVSPVERVVGFTYEKINTATDYLFGSREMRAENQVLKAENQSLKEDLALSQEVIGRADFLENEYELLKGIDYDYKEAYVIGEGPSNIFGTYKISIGKNKDVEPGDIVIAGVKYTKSVYKEGLVGRVAEVGSNWSLVESIFYRDNSISFYNARTLESGVINSYGKDGLKGYVFDSEISVKEGDKLLTSNLGQTYPKGIYIGDIKAINKSDDADSQIIVEAKADFSNLYRVLVIDKDEVLVDE